MIIRRRHTANFTTIGNVLFNDERLRADELGILAFLLSRPNDWEVRRPQLAKRFDIGRDSIRRIIHNCMMTGWIVARKTRLSNGSFHTVYEVRDEPGPTLSSEQVKDALSLVSSEASEADEGDDDDRVGDHPPDSGPPDTGQPGVASQIRQTRRGSSKEELLNTDSVRTDSQTGGRDFADGKAKWPVANVLSYVACEALHAGLTDKDQNDAIDGMSGYLADCKAQNRKVCDLATYYRERRWERFSSQKQAPTFFQAQPGTPQWYRWKEYRLHVGQSVAQMDERAAAGLPWTVPSEWPPAMPATPEKVTT